MRDWKLTLATVVSFLLVVWGIPREETTATWVIVGLILLIGGAVCVVLMIRKIWRGTLRD